MDRSHIKNLTRRALIRNPSISLRQLGEALGITKDTAKVYRDEVIKENKGRMEREIDKLKKKSLEAELVDMETEIKELVIELWKIVSSNSSTEKDKTSAIRALLLARKQMFDLKFDAGLFVRELGRGTLDIPGMVKLIKENVGQDDNNKINSEL